MLADIRSMKREKLFREISEALRQWPELERKVFFQAHYRGQSPEAISRSLELNVQDVTAILKDCERRLHVSLRGFCDDDREASPFIPAGSPYSEVSKIPA